MSSDPSDQASDVEQRDRDLCIQAARQQASQHELLPKGNCYNCDEPVGPGERFCNGECRDDYTKREQAEIRKGRTQ